MINTDRLISQMIQAFVSAVEAKDKYTTGHALRVADYSMEISKRLGMSKEEQQRLYAAGLLHDIGKIGVPDDILNKTSKLTDAEYEIIKTHTVIGADILETISELPDLSVGARFHHEKYDGTGYPNRLKGEEIPKLAQIIAVADAYDAMTSSRSYRKPLEQRVVRQELVNGLGTQFAPKIADILISMIDEDVNYTMKQ